MKYIIILTALILANCVTNEDCPESKNLIDTVYLTGDIDSTKTVIVLDNELLNNYDERYAWHALAEIDTIIIDPEAVSYGIKALAFDRKKNTIDSYNTHGLFGIGIGFIYDKKQVIINKPEIRSVWEDDLKMMSSNGSFTQDLSIIEIRMTFQY